MSAFTEWWETQKIEVGQRGGYIYKREEAAWNAALDQLEGLADGWPERFKPHTYASENSDRYIGFHDGAKQCADELKARIKELRT